MKRRNAHNGVEFAAPDPVHSAKSSGLRYVTDRIPGITRRRAGRTFRYYDAKGKPLRDLDELRRIKALAVPPAWTNVWISPYRESHLQATGRDAKGRKQYRYHARWRQARDETKYDRMMIVGEILPKLRARIAKDLARPGLPRAKVIATVVKLLETTLIRVGNEQYARENNSFGLTTMRDKHVKINGSKIRFQFRGKGGVGFDLDLHSPRLARIVRRCQDLPGQELFQYIDEDGVLCAVDSNDVNGYLREVTGIDLTAKDFRTWAGTVFAARALQEFAQFASKSEAKRCVVKAIETVAKKLGNTRAVCRKSYIHPAVLNCYMDGNLGQGLARDARRELSQSPSGLTPEEAAVMAILERQLRAVPTKKVA